MSDHIQIGDISPRVQYESTGTETDFTYTFPIFKDTDLEVYIDGVLKTLAIDYSITGAGGSFGGVVTFAIAPADGAAITLVRRLANLPSIAVVGDGWKISAKKTSGDGNAVTVKRNGTDTIDGSISALISSAASGTTYVADTDGVPDNWTSVGFGAAAGNMTDERFVGGVDYIKTSSTSLTLSGNPGTEANMWVSFDGVWQHPDDYSLSSSILTFTLAIPADEVFVKYGATVPVGTPADGSVGTAQLINKAITAAKIATDAVGLDAIDTSVVATKTRDVNPQTGTNYTLLLSDNGGIVTMDNGAANTLTIPKNASVTFLNGSQIDVIQLGAGLTTIDTASGVTLNGVSDGNAAMGARYKGGTLVQLSTDNWNIVGAKGVVTNFESIGGLWVTSGSWNTASNGMLIANAGNIKAYFDLSYSGDFEITWGYSDISDISSSVATRFGIASINNLPFPGFLSQIADSYYVFDAPEQGVWQAYLGSTQVWTGASKTVDDTFILRRSGSSIALFRNGLLAHTYSTGTTATIAVLCDTNVTGTHIQNAMSREYADV